MTRCISPLAALVVLGLAGLFRECPAQEKQWIGRSVDFSHGRLVVSENDRFLMFEDGTPFFWLGDTAWELFHRPTKEEAERR